MNNARKCFALACALGLLAFHAEAAQPTPLEIKMDISGQWRLAAEQDGIQAYMRQGLKDGKRVFFVKFVNKSENASSFSWSMNEGTTILSKSDNVSLEAGQSSVDLKEQSSFIVEPEGDTNFLNSEITIRINH